MDDPEELHHAVRLYRRVFALSPTDPSIGPRLLAALRHNGGSVIGAFGEDGLVGFVYGFLGMDPISRELYHYSQTAAVAPESQGAGIGRALKLGQRDAVLATGIERMRWSFDPLRAANGHFNLDVLGARGRWFVPNLYGVERMGPDRGLPSDRMIVDWDLTAPTGSAGQSGADVPDSPPGAGETILTGGRMLIGVPSKPVHDPLVRNTVTNALAKALAAGWVAVSCVRRPSGACYVLETEPDARNPNSADRPGTSQPEDG